MNGRHGWGSREREAGRAEKGRLEEPALPGHPLCSASWRCADACCTPSATGTGRQRTCATTAGYFCHQRDTTQLRPPGQCREPTPTWCLASQPMWATPLLPGPGYQPRALHLGTVQLAGMVHACCKAATQHRAQWWHPRGCSQVFVLETAAGTWLCRANELGQQQQGTEEAAKPPPRPS